MVQLKNPNGSVGEGQEYIETFTGKAFPFLSPSVDDFDIRDIAHALSNTGRFNGHGRHFYSVAEHSVHVSRLVHPSLALAALLHDGSEAYLTDVASPIKPYLTNYKELENTIMKVIAKKWVFSWPLDRLIKFADAIALSTEAQELIPSKGELWNWEQWSPTGLRPDRFAFVPLCYLPKEAEQVFLERYNEIVHRV